MRQESTRHAAHTLLTWCLVVLVGAEVGAQSEGLFSAVDPDAARSARAGAREFRTSEPRTIRSRLVRIDLGMLDVARAAADGARGPAALTLNLFEDAVFRARVERSAATGSGYALTGRLEGVPFGTMALVVNGPVVAGTVRTPEATWQIRSAGAGLYVIRQVDLSTLPPGAEPLAPVPDDPRVPPADVGSADTEPADDDGSVIDVLVLHTPAAREAEGGTAEIEALVDLWVAETNQAYADSGVMHRIELVGQEGVAYVESGDAINHVLRLQSPYDGSMDHIHDIRDAYAADIVSLVYRRPEGERICGAGVLNYAMERDSNAPLWAFSASGVHCGPVSFAHELGHVMGLRHDRYVDWHENRPYPYSAGYVNQRAFDAGAPESSRWRTIMAYNDQCEDAGFFCQALLRFSNGCGSFS